MSEVLFPRGMYELMDAYDGFIIDQWGVLHNGAEANQKAVETLKQLKKLKKQVIILSNSAKRSIYNKELLKRLGFGSTYYIDVVTSGEVVWNGLHEQSYKPFDNIGKKCYVFTKNDNYNLLEGIDIQIVSNIEDADFILITGIDADVKDLSVYDDILKRAVEKRLPAISVSNGKIAIQGNARCFAPGALSERYQDLGGVVSYIGKPYKAIFQYCSKLFDGVIPSRILMIGDSIKSDTLGAASVDMDSMLITSGIHDAEFKGAETNLEKRKIIRKVARLYGSVSPKYIMDELLWQTKEAAEEDFWRERNNIE